MLFQTSLGAIINCGKKTKVTKLMITAIVMTAVILLYGHSFAQATSTVPDPPTGFTAIAISPTSISLNWNPPQNNGGSAITGYVVDYRIAPSSTYISLGNIGNVTHYTHAGLATSKTYIYRVSATNVNGTGNPSPERVATPTSSSTPPLNTAPNPPQSLTATVYSATQVNLSWNPPTSNGGPPVTGYKIDYKLDAGNFTVLISNTPYNTYSHTGLQTGHIYTYRVFAINSVGIGNSSNIASATPTQVNTVPSSPTSLVAYPASPTSISLSWNPPSNIGGSPIIGYKIEYYNGTSQFIVLVTNTGSAQTSYLHTGLVTGKSYTYRVSAINSAGTSPPSNTISATPQQTTSPIIVSAVATSPTQIGLAWIPPSQTYGQLINGYRIDQIVNGNYIPLVDSTDSASTTYTITGLTTGKTYNLSITALLSAGSQSSPSASVSVTPTSSSSAPAPPPPNQNPPPTQGQAVPDPPSNLNATLVSQNTVKLFWIAPSNNGKPPVSGFKVESKTNSSSTWSVLVPDIGFQTSYVKSGLQLGTTYSFRISAINSVGTSQPSNVISVTPGNPSSNQTSPQPPPITPPVSAGMVSVANTTSTISYHIIGGQVVGAGANPSSLSVNIKIQANSDGILFVQLPRDLIDAKKSDGSDDVYYVFEDKNIASFNETKTSAYRTLAISFPAKTNEVSIIGTNVVPEFPIAMLALLIGLVPIVLVSRRIGK